MPDTFFESHRRAVMTRAGRARMRMAILMAAVCVVIGFAVGWLLALFAFVVGTVAAWIGVAIASRIDRSGWAPPHLRRLPPT